MKLSEFDYYLPEELIAQEPAESRDKSRLLVLHRDTGAIEHRRFTDCIEYFRPGDVLVLNNTRVIPARLIGVKEGTGARIEVVLLKRAALNTWETLVKPGKRVRPGTRIVFGDGMLAAEAVGSTDAGGRVLCFSYDGVFEDILDRLGQMPLPPYIRKELHDRERYQTVYARVPGSAAAPTAGLHFTPELLERIAGSGIEKAELLLHVGLGTFRPVKTENILEHKMHAEYYEMSPEAATAVNRAKKEGGRVISVGTTSARTLETAAGDNGMVTPGSGWTDIFIYPGYRFKAVDMLITNFHLPKSTLLMLVAAFAGREKVLEAYRQAVSQRYRFFSFGDAMLIL
ncbi:tRNA preQ1(34) S-adenosylmethionine ribosyltransferase-isomerase QueA [Phosphitispora fastidiosa]|uniref:tRNA preQ1(34) S-adenosylmethionine ribosyltransferase-isomerase QueA n=1 Tax=Phosphitispora fastidiosa TaxID=2837202 RepID=UPI001E323E99|nr:S-adenosylmethionine:tRNA ribosyltransferase-isomerase [Phosphitispora fastidiosa]